MATMESTKVQVPARNTVSQEVVMLATRVLDRANELAEEAENKLVPVLKAAAFPGPEKKAAGEPIEVYPPLFYVLRDRLVATSEALDKIKETLDRAAL